VLIIKSLRLGRCAGGVEMDMECTYAKIFPFLFFLFGPVKYTCHWHPREKSRLSLQLDREMVWRDIEGR